MLNPDSLLDDLNFHRATKTAFELAMMRKASDVGAAGHVAAATAFYDGGTEFDIHLAYLAASQQAEMDLPYGNIIALNEHASVLHYHNLERTHAAPPRSFLIDAGGNYRGYASDISRTYASQGPEHQTFADLIDLMEEHQRRLVAQVKPGVKFAELHANMHQGLTAVLIEAGLIQGTLSSPCGNVSVRPFVHTASATFWACRYMTWGGIWRTRKVTLRPQRENYPSLRFTRAVEEHYVFTIEPGLYFINSLLAKLRARKLKSVLNWDLIDALTPYGGIRIEDDVAVISKWM